MRRTLFLVSFGVGLLLAPSCGDSFSGDDCPEGSETCLCYRNDSCDDGLACRSGICIDLGSVGAAGAPGCPDDSLECDGICVGVASDNLNCGDCATECLGGSRCVEGDCACEGGRTLCETGCTNTIIDNANCGDCGAACNTGESCEAGACACQAGLAPCTGGCVATTSHPDHCGGCSNACPSDQVCSESGCAASCAEGLTECDRACVDVQVSVEHCGGCNAACPAGQSCSAGECTCDGGLDACGALCVDVQTDAGHCGACGNSCGPGQTCNMGVCACGGGQDSCEGSGCVNTSDNAQHCGVCNNACTFAEVCQDGACACRPGTEPCGAGCAAPGMCGSGGMGGSGGSSGAGGTSSGGAGGSGGTPPEPRCAGVPPTCGPDGATDCCAASLVPGGTFNRGNDPLYPATVSDFRLDDFEVTVGRFRPFVAAFAAGWRPTEGSGKNPSDPEDDGWMSSTYLPPSPAYNGSTAATWTEAPGPNESRPINFVRWGVSFAFCIWDEGRLPTEAEWNYAAAGGGDAMGQRVFPWSVPSSSETIDSSQASYGCTSGCFVAPVGSKPNGKGRWGHSDLAGNVSEWTRDGSYSNGQSIYPIPCIDCTYDGGSNRVHRGGSINYTEFGLYTYLRAVSPEGTHYKYFVGFRCARAP